MKRILSLLLILILLFSIFSCGNDGDAATPEKKEVLTLNVYNWGEYISDGSEGSLDSIKEFERWYLLKHGQRVEVNYSTYATNEDMYSKLKNSAVIYDIVIPSDYMIQKMIAEDMLLAFDATTIEGFEYIDEQFKNSPYYDPENLYSVPYTYGMVGIIYNSDIVSEEDVQDESWGLLWNEKYAGKMLQFNNPRDAFATAMYYHGLDVNSKDPEVWDEALEYLKAQKPLLQGYVNDEIFNKMTSASAAVAPYYVGDYITMAEELDSLEFYYPKEGTNYFVDAMCIPKNAAEPEVAKEFITFMLTEEPAVENALYIGYASPNTLVAKNEYYKEEMGEEALELLYGTPPNVINAQYNEKFGTACYENFSSDIQARINTLWENLKIHDSTEPWIHVTSIAIVSGVLVWAGYSVYIKKKRSRDYRMRDEQLRKNKN